MTRPCHPAGRNGRMVPGLFQARFIRPGCKFPMVHKFNVRSINSCYRERYLLDLESIKHVEFGPCSVIITLVYGEWHEKWDRAWKHFYSFLNNQRCRRVGRISSDCGEEDWKRAISPKQMYVCILLSLAPDDKKCSVANKAQQRDVGKSSSGWTVEHAYCWCTSHWVFALHPDWNKCSYSKFSARSFPCLGWLRELLQTALLGKS